MSALRSARFPAVLLLVAAVVGVALANTPASSAVFAVQGTALGIPGTVLDLTVEQWIADGLLAVFFFTVAVELQVELTAGELRSIRRAALPALAAVAGVVGPVIVYVIVAAPHGLARGWPVPTATDIAFALGVLAVFGAGLPSGVRVFLLALAILDDIIGIVFIAVLFARGLHIGMLVLSVALIAVFGGLSRIPGRRGRTAVRAAMAVVVVAAWVAMLASGVHATIAGVLLGLAVAQQPGLRMRHALQPWVNGAVLPVFALSAALVTVPHVGAGGLSPVFWGICIGLPLGKLVGITGVGWLAQKLLRVPPAVRLGFADLLAVGTLGGIGFTVSLLLAGLAFAGDAVLRDDAVLGVLCGSLIAVVLAAITVAWRSRVHARMAA